MARKSSTGYDFVTKTKNRHGTVKYIYKPPGLPKHTMAADYGTPAFAQEYLDLVKKAQGVPALPVAANDKHGPHVVRSGSLRWLVVRYYRHAAFQSLDAETKGHRTRNLDGVCKSIHPETDGPRGNLAFAKMARVNIKAIRAEAMPRGVAAANAVVGALRVLFNWAIDEELATINPAANIEALQGNTEGHHTWTDDEMTQYEARYPVGTKARLAFDVLLYTGVRQSDAIRFSRPMMKGGAFHFTEYKGSHSKVVTKRRPKPKHRVVSIAPELQRSIDKTPSDGLMILTSKTGRPYSKSNFEKQIRRWCDKAGLPLCTSHGIRKGGATIIGDNGGTGSQLLGLYGWTELQQADTYVARANRTKLATDALGVLSKARKAARN